MIHMWVLCSWNRARVPNVVAKYDVTRMQEITSQDSSQIPPLYNLVVVECLCTMPVAKQIWLDQAQPNSRTYVLAAERLGGEPVNPEDPEMLGLDEVVPDAEYSAWGTFLYRRGLTVVLARAALGGDTVNGRTRKQVGLKLCNSLKANSVRAEEPEQNEDYQEEVV